MVPTVQKAIAQSESPYASNPEGYQACFWDKPEGLIFLTHLLHISRQVVNLQYTQSWCSACLQHKAGTNSTSLMLSHLYLSKRRPHQNASTSTYPYLVRYCHIFSSILILQLFPLFAVLQHILYTANTQSMLNPWTFTLKKKEKTILHRAHIVQTHILPVWL